MGLYDLLAFRTDGTVLTGFGSTSDIFNADHENHVTHTAAAFLNSWEEDVTQMRLTTAPTTSSGAVSLPTVLKDEIERLRYQIARIKQQIAGAATPPYWYTPTASFTDGVQFPPTAGRAELSTAQSIPDGPYTTVLFNVTVYETGGVTRSPGVLRVPVSGVYLCGGTLAFDIPTAGPGLIELVLMQSHVGVASIIAAQSSYNTTSFRQALTVETVKHFDAGDSLALRVKQQTGAAQAPLIASDQRPALWIALLGRD